MTPPRPERERVKGEGELVIIDLYMGKEIEKPTRSQINLARELRRKSTTAERVMWGILRNCQLEGLKFYRQVPIGKYIVDFCSKRHKLIIEIDGGVHVGKEKQDQNRQMYLEKQGFRVMRFTNDQIFNDLNQVAEEIRRFLNR
jgi:very-short-patch-repair endonuclease